LVQPLQAGETELIFEVQDEHGAITHDTVSAVVNIVLANEEPVNKEYYVFPNPVELVANVYLNAEWRGLINLELTDNSGKKQGTYEVERNNTDVIKINVSQLAKGAYVLKVKSSNRNATIKILKK
jgi:hypothetical protein